MENKLDLNSVPKTYDDWGVGDKYEIIKEIGVGSYGSVV
jgi:mitogen-activated protein kinase 1/3